MKAREEARMKTMEFLANELAEKDVSPIMAMGMNMHTIMVLGMYEENLKELTGDTNKLLEALTNGGFTDENGTSLTDTITFKQLREQLES